MLMGRQPYYDLADSIVRLCVEKKIDGRMAAHSVPNMFYILRKSMSDEERRKVLKLLCQIVKVEGIDADKVLSALDNSEFQDFEDCLQEECAVMMNAEYIITRNVKDFSASRVPAILPEDFLKKCSQLD